MKDSFSSSVGFILASKKTFEVENCANLVFADETKVFNSTLHHQCKELVYAVQFK